MENNEFEKNTHQEHYESIKVLVESIEKDMLKSEKGNKSAGIRLRKSLRLLKKYSQDFVKFSLDN